MSLNHKELEQKWQKKWEEEHCFRAEIDKSKRKFYALSMFPYPSASGLHIGHLASYTPTEVVARYKRAQGFNVLHPMGYDAFGLPAEQYAIRTGVHPALITKQAIDNFRRQLKSFGYSFDWSKEISTCEPEYYKWTQFLFIQFLKKGLAYQKKVPVNWCPALKTILANEEVIEGKSERGGHPVIKKPVKQWLLAITKYADRLLKGLDSLDWPERTIEGQRNWIGKSTGARIYFPVKDSKKIIEVFTTRPDTLFGLSFIALSPEHPLLDEITTKEQKPAVSKYQKTSLSLSDVDRKTAENKTGVFTGAYVIHPFTKELAPVWTADYVLMDYGTGAVMAVPAHDERDFDFAKTFRLPIKKIIKCKTLPFTGQGEYTESNFLNGLTNTEQGIKKIIQKLEKSLSGKKETQYKLKDWIFSRQRYWGEPFPVVHFTTPDGKQQETRPVPDSELPVTLPSTARYEPSEKGEPPLARQEEFICYTDSKTGSKGKRDDNTMPGYAASSWYFLRYTDSKNDKAPFDFEKQKYWMPVDLYVGGAEHTVGHLLYSRFWQNFLYDHKMTSHPEPFKKLVHQGMILGEDNQKMSKSRGNTANPDALRDQYGADTIRVFISFLGPLEKDKPWSSAGIEGSRRFLERIWRLVFNEKGKVLPEQGQITPALQSLFNYTIQKVTQDIENLNFNTAISSMMILVNELYRKNIRSRHILKTLSQLLQPFAPHIAEEIWSALGGKGFVSLSPWPQQQKNFVQNKVKVIGVQVNGKTRASISVSEQTSEESAVKTALSKPAVVKALKGKNIKKVIYKPCRILNIINQ